MKIKKRFVPHVIPSEDEECILSNLVNQSDKNAIIQEGSIVSGNVIAVKDDVVIVDCKLKNEGRIPISEFTIDKVSTIPEVGDIVDVYIQKIENKYGKTVLSRAKAIQKKIWQDLKKSYNSQELVYGKIYSKVKEGLVVNLFGINAFLPGSHIDVKPINDKDVDLLMGIEQPFLILKMDEKLDNVIVSRRAVLEASNVENKEATLAKIQKGMILEGVVKNITSYGAFVNLGNIDGLVYITDISWARINHPSEVLVVGQQIKVMVIKVENKRISLGIKQIENSIWKAIVEEFPVEHIGVGKITNITDTGAFIELRDGIEGWVYSGEVSWIKSQQIPKKVLTIGQEIQYKVIDVDNQKYRITLSIKQCQENPWRSFLEKNPIGSIIKSTIRNITDFGLFVMVADKIDGLIHVSDLSWENNGAELLNSYNKGDLIECKVMSVDLEKEKISLSVKHLTENQYEALWVKYTKGSIFTGIVTKVHEEGIEVKINDEIYGVVKKNDIAIDKTDQKSDRFSIGEKMDIKVIGVNKQERRLLLSIKQLEEEEREKIIKEYGSADSGASLGDILGNKLDISKKSV